ncbi:MAG: hypothetical protein ISQ11_16035 [Planctomycetes bacterium]|nr:hypothetical protein [Planctomycetota bacterium]
MKLALLASIAALPLLGGCITETEGSVGTSAAVRTEGVIVVGDIDQVWARTSSIVRGMASGPVQSAGLERSLRTEVRGREVVTFVEPYDARRTVVHVRCNDPAIAERIRMRVMSY